MWNTFTRPFSGRFPPFQCPVRAAAGFHAGHPEIFRASTNLRGGPSLDTRCGRWCSRNEHELRFKKQMDTPSVSRHRRFLIAKRSGIIWRRERTPTWQSTHRKSSRPSCVGDPQLRGNRSKTNCSASGKPRSKKFDLTAKRKPPAGRQRQTSQSQSLHQAGPKAMMVA
ncbi:MAG: hypothetical protein DDT25_01065 [Chloroflexi bacterium]|nr:hypothetical protein [Chloroflexota bacterium]